MALPDILTEHRRNLYRVIKPAADGRRRRLEDDVRTCSI